MYLDAKWKLKWSESEINVRLVNVNVDEREGLWSILTKIVGENCDNNSFLFNIVIDLSLQLMLRISTVRISSYCYWR